MLNRIFYSFFPSKFRVAFCFFFKLSLCPHGKQGGGGGGVGGWGVTSTLIGLNENFEKNS